MDDNTPSEKHEVITEAVGFDFRKLWRTVKDLTVKPGETIAAYCDGLRTQYISPITYFLLTYGLNFFITHLFVKNDDLTKPFESGFRQGNPNVTDEHLQSAMAFIKPGFEFAQTKEGTLLIYLPILIILQWLFYRKYRKSFFQNLYFYLYITAQADLLTVPLIMALGWSASVKTLLVVTVILFSAAFYFYAIPRFYIGITVKQIILRTLGQIVAAIIPFLIWFMIVSVAAAFIIQKFFS